MAKKQANKKRRAVFVTFIVLCFLGAVVWYLHSKNFQVLNPAGEVARKQRNLMLVTLGLGLLVVIPVYIMTFTFAWHYRESNTKAKYSPELSGNVWAETIWWGVPTAIILVLSVITWNSSHALSPARALDVSAKTMTVEVVALDWKWLFIYPQQNMASVNLVQFPVGTPVRFLITADAPMNSFWIPQLGSQIYAMPGMTTQLNLVADKTGVYNGSSANISGDGFAGMTFRAAASSEASFSAWVQQAKLQGPPLNMSAYNQLAKPSEYNPVKLYASADPGLYDNVVLKYMVQGINNVR